MKTKLGSLRSRLVALRRARRTVRIGSAWSVVGTSVLWLLALAFLADWTFEMTVAQRVVLLLGCTVAFWWSLGRFATPFLGKGESVLDVALLVEKQQGIDSDLIAALEFEGEDAESWGSESLRDAVVLRAANIESRVDVFDGFSSDVLRRRLTVLLVTVLALASVGATFPDHALSFLRRIALGSQRYPTRTRIVEIRIGDRPLSPSGLAVNPATGKEELPKSAFGRALAFEVRCEGELPGGALVELESLEGQLTSGIELVETDVRGVYRGEVDRLTESIRYEIQAGDARTDPARVEVIPLPVVHLELVAHAPKYVVDRGRVPRVDPGARRIAVVEGTTVDVRLRSSNVALATATMTMGGNAYPLDPTDSDSKTWSLATERSPLTPVTKAVVYSIQVLDRNGLSLEQPIEGTVRTLTDRKPVVRAVVVSRKVLPTAKPRIEYAARDDYGLDRIELCISVERSGREPEEEVRRVIRKLPGPQPKVESGYVLDLAPFGLRKDDRLELSVEAFDHRGDFDAKSARSDALVLHVTDERGVINSMHESDERSARQLDAIIEKQLGIGGSR